MVMEVVHKLKLGANPVWACAVGNTHCACALALRNTSSKLRGP